MRYRSLLLSVVLTLALAVTALARSRRPTRPLSPEYLNVPYDGVHLRARELSDRARTATGTAAGRRGPTAIRSPKQNLMRIMNEVSLPRRARRGDQLVTFDDPELFKYPIAYIIEADWWAMTDSEAAALRAYMQKGGFVIVDDFKPPAASAAGLRDYGDGTTAAAGRARGDMKHVLPEARFFDMDASASHLPLVLRDRRRSTSSRRRTSRPADFRGLYEDNDPTKRLLMVVNYNTDISQFWEWSGRACGRSTTPTKPTSWA